jgi:hypothetical protein
VTFHGLYFVTPVKETMAGLPHHAEIVTAIALHHQRELRRAFEQQI